MIQVGKFLFWNIIISAAMTLLSGNIESNSNDETKYFFYLACMIISLVIMVLLFLTLFIKAIIGIIYMIKYKCKSCCRYQNNQSRAQV